MGKSKLENKSPRPKNLVSISKPTARPKPASAVGGGSAANIKVVVRVRPPNIREQDDNHRTVVDILDEQMLIFDPKENNQGFFYHGVQQKYRDLLRKPNKNMQFLFDRVFGFEATNNEIFESTTKSLIQSLMDGYNCSVFAYGATGAGKTHTMLGQIGNPGITYLTMTELFRAKQELSAERKFELGITYLEVYNELVQDLLNPGPPLQLREDSKYGVTVAGIKMHRIEDPDKLFSLLEQGNGNRTQHPTDANAESSRSHAVFQVYIQMEIKATREVRAAKLSMIDLAGSERGSVTGFGGARFTEGANINKSLLALGNCINSLADGQRHVPYRDSKLTRLLKDSLGGNCQTIMVANISPSSLSYEDTYNTLKYATRAKKIKSNMRRNVVNVELGASEYMKIVEELKKELESVRSQLCEKNAPETAPDSEDCNAQIPTVNQNKIDEFMELIKERRKLVDRMFNVESTENVVMLRRHFKETVETRLSGLCESTPEKEDLHRRLGNTVNRLQKQEDTLQSELSDMKRSKVELEMKCENLVKEYPELARIADTENARLAQAEAQFQLELEKKKNAVLEEELKSEYVLLRDIWKTLQPCYVQLKGHGFATDVLIKQYQSLVRHLQGFKNITWDAKIGPSSCVGNNSTDNTTTSGSLSTVASVPSVVDVRSESQKMPTVTSANTNGKQPAKRKINDENSNSNSLDHTFVLQPPKLRAKVRAEELMTKVYDKPVAKRTVRDNMLLRKARSPRGLTGSRTALTVQQKKTPEKNMRRPFRT